MSALETLAEFFKPEVKASGAKLILQDKISKPNASDTGVHAYFKTSPSAKVVFSSHGVGSETFQAECNCPVAKKERLCKHIWATVLAVEETYPDFLSAKLRVDLAGERETQNDQEPRVESTRKSEAKARQDAYAAAAKARAAEFRKEQYQKYKARAKSFAKKKKNSESVENAPNYPSEVAAACAYFSQNGFSLSTDLTEESISKAKRVLSRVFHPDKGGSHAEMVELNRNWEIMREYLRRAPV